MIIIIGFDYPFRKIDKIGWCADITILKLTINKTCIGITVCNFWINLLIKKYL